MQDTLAPTDIEATCYITGGCEVSTNQENITTFGFQMPGTMAGMLTNIMILKHGSSISLLIMSYPSMTLTLFVTFSLSSFMLRHGEPASHFIERVRTMSEFTDPISDALCDQLYNTASIFDFAFRISANVTGFDDHRYVRDAAFPKQFRVAAIEKVDDRSSFGGLGVKVLLPFI